MQEDLHALGEDLITTSARIVRWVPRTGDLDLSLSAARILARLLDNGPTRISELAIAELCSQPTITNHIKRLEGAGLVSRSADPGDARAFMISLTDAGRTRLRDMRTTLGTALEPYLALLTEDDIHALQHGVAAMRRLVSLDRLPQ